MTFVVSDAGCSTVCIAGTAAALYWGVGFFGAALLGRAAVTEANILQNDLGGGWWQAVLNITFAGKLGSCASYVSRRWHLLRLWVVADCRQGLCMDVQGFLRAHAWNPGTYHTGRGAAAWPPMQELLRGMGVSSSCTQFRVWPGLGPA